MALRKTARSLRKQHGVTHFTTSCGYLLQSEAKVGTLIASSVQHSRPSSFPESAEPSGDH